MTKSQIKQLIKRLEKEAFKLESLGAKTSAAGYSDYGLSRAAREASHAADRLRNLHKIDE